MPEENRLSQAGVFLGAAALAIVVMVIVPQQCRKNAEEKESNWFVAGSPDAISSRTKPKSTSATTAPAVQSKLAKSGVGNFLETAQALALKPIDEIGEALDELMDQWALTDPTAAAAWVKQLPLGDFREAASVSLCQTWAAEDPQAASTWVSANVAGGGMQAAVGSVTSVWAEKSPEEAAAWVATLTDPANRLVGETSLAQAWGETNPAAAAAWWETLPPETQQIALQNLLIGWSAKDPSAAAAWLQGALASHAHLSADVAVVVVDAWSSQDAGAVSKWLNALPDGPFYEVAATAFSQSAAEKSPKDALQWARSLADPTNREAAIVNAMDKWYDQDRTAFINALPKELEATTDPALRKAIYNLLYHKDPGFKASMLDLTELPDPNIPAGSNNQSDAPPAADQPAASPVAGDQAQ